MALEHCQLLPPHSFFAVVRKLKFLQLPNQCLQISTWNLICMIFVKHHLCKFLLHPAEKQTLNYSWTFKFFCASIYFYFPLLPLLYKLLYKLIALLKCVDLCKFIVWLYLVWLINNTKHTDLETLQVPHQVCSSVFVGPVWITAVQ